MRVNKTFLWIMVVFVVSGVVMVGAGRYFNSKWGSAGGLVIDAATGKSLAGAEVTLSSTFTSERKGAMQLVRSGKSRDDGRFRIPTTVGGTYVMTVERVNYESLRLDAVTLASARYNDLGTLAMKRVQ